VREARLLDAAAMRDAGFDARFRATAWWRLAKGKPGLRPFETGGLADGGFRCE